MSKKITVTLLALLVMVSISVTAMAADFTPSVTGKAAPEIVTVENSAGKKVAAIICDANGKESTSVSIGGLIVTPVSEAQQADAPIRDSLLAAYDHLTTTALDKIAPSIDKAIKNYSPDMTIDDLVIRDLFDVSLSDEDARQQLAKSGSYIKIQFNLNLPPDALLLVLRNRESTNWELISDDRVIRNSDGSVTVEFDSLSPIAFLVDGGQVSVNPNAPASPQTGYASFPPLLWGTAGIGIVVLAAIVLVIKKRPASN